ncbi:MAG: trehalose synthase, partial [Pseudomonas sp.]|nr:trehalose synthase [Pseudomonas sp.]
LIHALQNHDELTLELVHFWTLHANDSYLYKGQTFPGNILREHIRSEMYEALAGEHAPYNLKFVTNGVSCTTVSIITAALGIRDLTSISAEQKALIQKVHLLLAMYNAFQPGIFALSGWDLVGALPLMPEQVAPLMVDGDTRWIHRGAYDLADLAPGAQVSGEGLPKARMLYGSLNEQLEDPDSFTSTLKKMLAVRQAYAIASSRQILIPEVNNPSLLLMVHELPAGKGIQITALNFGAQAISEELYLPDIGPGIVVDMINERLEGELSEAGHMTIHLDGYEGLSLRIVGSAGPALSHSPGA